MFHLCPAGSNAVWQDFIVPLINRVPDARCVTQDYVPVVGAGKWARRVSAYYWRDQYPGNPGMAGSKLADNVAAILDNGAGLPIPSMVMIDEIAPTTNQIIATCANILFGNRPQYNGRWGAFLISRNSGLGWDSMSGAIDQLLMGACPIAAEIYVEHSSYCNRPLANRDPWLRDQMIGGGTAGTNGYAWLVNRRAAINAGSPTAPGSRLPPVFGVTNSYCNGPQTYRFLSRMFYVWKTQTSYASFMRTGYPSNVTVANQSGVGGYIWETGKTDPNREAYFAESHQYYAEGSGTAPLYSVTC